MEVLSYLSYKHTLFLIIIIIILKMQYDSE